MGLQGMNLDPSMMNMMKDLDGAEMNKQLETLGLSPSEVINKIMAEPDLAAAFQKPKVMQVTIIPCCQTIQYRSFLECRLGSYQVLRQGSGKTSIAMREISTACRSKCTAGCV